MEPESFFFLSIRNVIILDTATKFRKLLFVEVGKGINRRNNKRIICTISVKRVSKMTLYYLTPCWYLNIIKIEF